MEWSGNMTSYGFSIQCWTWWYLKVQALALNHKGPTYTYDDTQGTKTRICNVESYKKFYRCGQFVIC